MKKFILAAALVAAMAPAAIAQDEFAPEKGDFGVELQFNPFSNDYTTFRDSEYGLTGRYFITNKDALSASTSVSAFTRTSTTPTTRLPKTTS